MKPLSGTNVSSADGAWLARIVLALVAACITAFVVVAPSSAQSERRSTTSCNQPEPYRVSYNIRSASSRGDRGELTLRQRIVMTGIEDYRVASRLTYTWAPRRGFVVCRFVVRHKNGQTYVSRNSRGGSYTFDYLENGSNHPLAIYVTGRDKRR